MLVILLDMHFHSLNFYKYNLKQSLRNMFTFVLGKLEIVFNSTVVAIDFCIAHCLLKNGDYSTQLKKAF